MHPTITKNHELPPPANPRALSDLLQKYGLDTARWGREATKSIAELFEEIQAGETRLCVANGKLLREVRVVNIDVIAEDDQGRLCRLTEARQVFADGSERVRETGTSVAEKVLGSETIEQAARRGLEQEIGLRVNVELRALAPLERMRESDSYPGLPGRYRIFPGFVRLTAAQRDSISLKERQDTKTTYFEWRPIDR